MNTGSFRNIYTVFGVGILALTALYFITATLTDRTENGEVATSLDSAPMGRLRELVFIFQKQRDPSQMKTQADLAAERLTEIIGIPVKAQIPGDYSASVQAIISKKADFAYVDSMSSVIADRDGNAKIILAEERIDINGTPRLEYDSVFVAQKDSGLNSISDVIKNSKDLRISFTSPTSTSGYLFPYMRLVDEGVLTPRQDVSTAFKKVNFGGSYDLALKQVLNGNADIATVSHYAVEGASADRYLSKEDQAQLKIIARTPGVPTHVIIARDGLDDSVISSIKTALIKIGETEPDLLRDIYGASKFVEVDRESHISATKRAIELSGIPIS